MKKNILIISALAFLFAIAFTSCNDDVVAGGTAVEKISGEWVTYSPDFDMSFHLKTSSTSDNESDKIIVTDITTAGTSAGFWGFTVKSDCDLSALTFSCTNVTNQYWTEKNGVYTPYDIKISIRNGKITEKAIELPSGVKADKIELEIWFEDIADAGAPADYYCTLVGYRYSGFLEDEDFVYTGDEE